VTSRTIKRDLAALEAGGLPVWGRTGPGGGYGLAQGSSLPPVNFTAAQALALSAAVAVSTQAPFSDAARTATRKVLDVLDPLVRRRATDLSHRVWVDVGPSAPRRVMSVLEQALVDQVTVNLAYTDAQGRSTRREVEPMIFALTGGRWLLVAWCRLRDDVRWFNLSRIQAATATRHPCTGHDISEIGPPPSRHGRSASDPPLCAARDHSSPALWPRTINVDERSLIGTALCRKQWPTRLGLRSWACVWCAAGRGRRRRSCGRRTLGSTSVGSGCGRCRRRRCGRGRRRRP